jgi:hypothetical protein
MGEDVPASCLCALVVSCLGIWIILILSFPVTLLHPVFRGVEQYQACLACTQLVRCNWCSRIVAHRKQSPIGKDVFRFCLNTVECAFYRLVLSLALPSPPFYHTMFFCRFSRHCQYLGRIESNGRLMDEGWTGKNLEGNCLDLIEVLVQKFASND